MAADLSADQISELVSVLVVWSGTNTLKGTRVMNDRCEHFISRYPDQFRTVRRYAVADTCECVYLGAGAYAFWARLPNRYDVAVSNNEMDGVPGGSDRFTVCVYLDGGFIANLVDGTLDDQLLRASAGAFTKAAIPATAAADHTRTLTTLYAEEIQALESAGWESVHPVGTGDGCTAIEAHKGHRYLLATDGDHALVRGRDDEQPTGWLVSLYDTQCDDEAIAYAEAYTLMSALARALAAQGL